MPTVDVCREFQKDMVSHGQTARRVQLAESQNPRDVINPLRATHCPAPH